MPIFSQFGEIVWQRLFNIARILQTTALKVHLLTRQPELEILVVVKSKNTSGWPRIGNFLIVFNKAHTYYPTYDIEAYFSD